MQLLSDIFDDSTVHVISSMQTMASDHNDILRWKPSKTGACTTKEIYKALSMANAVQLPQQGSWSILPHSSQLLRRTWKSKDLPPLIKTFTWRLIRRALASVERAGRYSHIDQHCDTCGAIETDSHLFFHYDLPRQVWLSFTPPLRTNNLPTEDDGVQLTLQSIISPTTTEAAFNRILFTLWYI